MPPISTYSNKPYLNGHIKKEPEKCDTNNDINPFINDVLKNLTFLQKIQVALCTFTVAPIRLILLLLSFAFLWPIGIILAKGRTEEEKSVPLKGWRKTFLPVARFFSRCVFWSASYHWISIKGERDLSAPILIFAPHSGFFDSMLITYMNFVSVIGRKGSEETPLFGNLTNLCQPIIVDRDNKSSREKSVKQIIDRVNSTLDWPPLSIFAEGTCTNRKALIKFKTGAFKPGVPVQPVCMNYSSKVMDTSSWTWDGPHWFIICWLALCQVYSPVEFEFMPIYYPDDEEKLNPELFADNVRNVMAKKMNIPVSDYTFEDAKFVQKSLKYGLPSSAGLIDIQNMKRKLEVNVEDIHQLIPIYSKLADTQTGICYLDKFSKNLGLVINSHVERLFQLFDKENSGNFSFKIFIEVYFATIHKIDYKESIDHVLNSLEFSSTQNYSIDEFQKVIKNKFNVDFVHFNSMNLKIENTEDTKNIDKVIIEEYLNNNVLVLYLLSKIAR